MVVMEMFYSIVKPVEGETNDDSSDDEMIPTESTKKIPGSIPGMGITPSGKMSARASEIQSKIRSVAKLLTMQRMLREKSEDALKEKKDESGKGPNERRPD